MKTSAVPVVTVITPEASTVGTRILVTGANLDFVESATVGGVKCKVEDVTATTLTVIVGDDAKSGPVVLINDTGPSANRPLFTVTVPDKIPPKKDRTGKVIGPSDPQPNAPNAPNPPWKSKQWKNPGSNPPNPAEPPHASTAPNPPNAPGPVPNAPNLSPDKKW